MTVCDSHKNRVTIIVVTVPDEYVISKQTSKEVAVIIIVTFLMSVTFVPLMAKQRSKEVAVIIILIFLMSVTFVPLIA